MANILQPAEIVEIGIEKEKKRRDFYAIAADHFKENEELAKLFAKLRDWEDEHIKKFTEIRDHVSKAQYTESYPGETEAYMKALIDSELYDEVTPEAFAAKGPPPAEIDGQPIPLLGAVAFTYPFNLSGHPAATVRTGLTPSGLPAGLQIIGPRHCDERVLQAACLYVQAFSWNDQWPNLDAD